MRGVPTIWLEAEEIGEHVHVKVYTGRQFGQVAMPNYNKERGHANDGGLAGSLIMRADGWPLFIQSLARGGAETGMRVLWRLTPSDGRFLWNGLSCDPCIVGEQEPVPWEKP